MRQTTPEVYIPRQHVSESWSAMRVARRLVERHGFKAARQRALRQKACHSLALRYGSRDENTAFRIIFWGLVAVNAARFPEPARFLVPSETAA